ncbi:MAG: RNA helicase [Erysipelotrichaceae bacterium]|nr:RNA helicase [Erysipelotrichaceae bacterium]
MKSTDKKLKCGIVMPITKHHDYPDSHWSDVLNILVEAIDETEFEPSLVSDDPAIGLIHDRIVSNLYSNDIVVCDVSSKNPNVMFELGLRLAFDKPTIIIKDELTGFSFDTGVIEHIPYPSSLRFSQIVEFKQALIKKINGTYDKAKEDPNFSPFLKSFGQKIIPAKINGQEISETKYILQSLQEIQNEMRVLRNKSINNIDYISEKEYINFKELYFLKEKLDEFINKNGIVKSEIELDKFMNQFMNQYKLNISKNTLVRLINELDYDENRMRRTK